MSLEYHEIPITPEVAALVASIPEFETVPLEKLLARTEQGGLLVVAREDARVVGFKLGHVRSPEVFYSWIGGVVPEYRGRGVARSLLKFQEQLVRERGHSRIRVKSLNRFPAMLRMLIAEGYRIIDLESPREPGHELKIVFEKDLSLDHAK